MENSSGIIHIIHVDDDPTISRSLARTVLGGTAQDGETTVDFSPATGLQTFLTVLERLGGIREQLGKVLVITDGTMNPVFPNDLIGCHGLDLLDITAARIFGKDLPPKLRDREGLIELITGAAMKPELTERIMAIPQEVYKKLKYLMLSGDAEGKLQTDYYELFKRAPVGMMWKEPMVKPFRYKELRKVIETFMGIKFPA